MAEEINLGSGCCVAMRQQQVAFASDGFAVRLGRMFEEDNKSTSSPTSSYSWLEAVVGLQREKRAFFFVSSNNKAGVLSVVTCPHGVSCLQTPFHCSHLTDDCSDAALAWQGKAIACCCCWRWDAVQWGNWTPKRRFLTDGLRLGGWRSFPKIRGKFNRERKL